MSWSELSPESRAFAERVCTPEQLAAFKLWNGGANWRHVGATLGIAASTARGRIERAVDAMRLASEREGEDPSTALR